jgi:hypothetical protein
MSTTTATTTMAPAAAFANNSTAEMLEPIISNAEKEAGNASNYPQRRNKGIAEVIRAGWTTLNQTALDIQNSATTRKPLFTSGSGDMQGDEEQVSPSVKAEEHRILSVAKDCLHQIAQSQRGDEIAVFSVPQPPGISTNSSASSRGGIHSNAPVGDDGTMIVLLHVEVKKGSREAILYWCLPYDIMLDDNISSRQKQFLEFRVQQQLEQNGNKILQHRVHNVLRHYFPPKLRLEPATNDQLYSVLKELSDW